MLIKIFLKLERVAVTERANPDQIVIPKEPVEPPVASPAPDLDPTNPPRHPNPHQQPVPALHHAVLIPEETKTPRLATGNKQLNKETIQADLIETENPTAIHQVARMT